MLSVLFLTIFEIVLAGEPQYYDPADPRFLPSGPKYRYRFPQPDNNRLKPIYDARGKKIPLPPSAFDTTRGESPDFQDIKAPSSDFYDVERQITRSGKWPEFLARLQASSEKADGKVMENWEEDAMKWADWAKNMNQQMMPERHPTTLRTIMRIAESAEDPSPGMGPYWSGGGQEPANGLTIDALAQQHEDLMNYRRALKKEDAALDLSQEETRLRTLYDLPPKVNQDKTMNFLNREEKEMKRKHDELRLHLSDPVHNNLPVYTEAPKPENSPVRYRKQAYWPPQIVPPNRPPNLQNRPPSNFQNGPRPNFQNGPLQNFQQNLRNSPPQYNAPTNFQNGPSKFQNGPPYFQNAAPQFQNGLQYQNRPMNFQNGPMMSYQNNLMGGLNNMPSMGYQNNRMGMNNIPQMGFQNIPRMGYNMPPMGNNMPPMANNMPPTANNMPPMANNMPPMANNMLPMANNMPPTGFQNNPQMGYQHSSMGFQNGRINYQPPMNNNIPPMPQMGNNRPQMGNNRPQMGNNRPAMGNNNNRIRPMDYEVYNHGPLGNKGAQEYPDGPRDYENGEDENHDTPPNYKEELENEETTPAEEPIKENAMLREGNNVPEPLSVTLPSPPLQPPTTVDPLASYKLPQADDYLSPIRWVKFNSIQIRDGLARVTDPDTGTNRQYNLNGTIYVPIIDPTKVNVIDIGVSTTAVPRVQTPMNPVRRQDLNVKAHKAGLDWTLVERDPNARGDDKMQEQCDEEGCQSRCKTPRCVTRCYGDTCSSGCQSEYCIAECSGPGCKATCLGKQCTAKCSGMACDARCQGQDCGIEFKCGGSNSSNTTYNNQINISTHKQIKTKQNNSINETKQNPVGHFRSESTIKSNGHQRKYNHNRRMEIGDDDNYSDDHFAVLGDDKIDDKDNIGSGIPDNVYGEMPGAFMFQKKALGPGVLPNNFGLQGENYDYKDFVRV